MPEINYKSQFCQKYFDKNTYSLDVLNEVDILLTDKKGNYLLYIESKYVISNDKQHRRALAQVILTNKKQKAILNKVALIYMDSSRNDVLELIDCSDNSVMYNNDINWKAEKPSNPTQDAIDRINDRIQGRITQYRNEEIREFYRLLKQNKNTEINITENNFNVVYNQWKNEVIFDKEIKNEQELINLFLIDILNGTNYTKTVKSELLGLTEQPLIREGTDLSKYKFITLTELNSYGFLYNRSEMFLIKDRQRYADFWRKYKRPPEKEEFLKILERSATLYSDKYRRDTGGEYTPSCFVDKQCEILLKKYNMDEYIVCDPCAGVGNLQNQFGKDFKQYCYLSTLEQMDVDICKIKGFENAIQFDYLKDDTQPKWKYKGTLLDINEICRRENRKLMIIMNPPYQNIKGHKYNLAIEFFNKVLALNPQVIVFYYMTESFLRDEIEQYKKSGYKIISHIFSSAKTTFLLSDWPISQVIFDRDKGEEIKDNAIKADRYELEKDRFVFKKTYTYDYERPSLINEIERQIKKDNQGMILGNYSFVQSCMNMTNKTSNNNNLLTTKNLIWCLLSKGICFNTHAKYFEWNDYMYKGKIENISEELFNDAIMFSLFYKGSAFTNRGQKNYIMPFTCEDLNCNKYDLNVLFPQDVGQNLFSAINSESPFDFRKFLKQFEFSEEAEKLYYAALEIFRYYHNNEYYTDKNWNDSFYDIINTIMGKGDNFSKEFETESDTRVSKFKTTKGTRGFGRNTVKYAVNSKYLPIFDAFFNARDILARKINKQLLEQGLLLWERENIY